MKREITMEFNGDGSPPKIEAHGFDGLGCKAATKALEDALGRVTSRKDTEKVGQRVKVGH